MYCRELCPLTTVEVEVITGLSKCLLNYLSKNFSIIISFWNKWIKSTCSCSFCKGSQATPAAAQSAVLWCEPDAATLWLQRLKTLVLAHQPWLSSTHLSPHYFVIHSHHNSIINNTQKMGQENDYGDPGWPGTQGHTSFPVSWIMKNPFVSFGRRVQDDEHQ